MTSTFLFPLPQCLSSKFFVVFFNSRLSGSFCERSLLVQINQNGASVIHSYSAFGNECLTAFDSVFKANLTLENMFMDFVQKER